MQTSRIVLAWLLLLCGLAPSALAQCEPSWATAAPQPELAGVVTCSTLWDPDGTGPLPLGIAVGGANLTGGTMPTNSKVGTWDGTAWHGLALGPGTAGVVRALTVWNGLLVAGGDFTGGGLDRIALWNGSSWQPLGSGFTVPVMDLTVWNGNLIAAGQGGGSGSQFPVLRAWNGAVWTALPSPSTLQTVKSIVSYQGLLCVAGRRNTPLSGVLERWNGTSWAPAIQATGGTTPTIQCLAVRGSLAVGGVDVLYVGGDFTSIGGVAATALASTSGGASFSWSAVGNNTASDCRSLVVRTSGLGGYAVTATLRNGVPYSTARYSSTSGTWATIGADAYAMIYLAGNYYGHLSSGGAWHRHNGTTWVPVLGPSLQGEVRALAPSGNDMILGGTIQSPTGAPLNGIARWNGTTFEPLGTGVTGTSVDALLERSNGDIVAGGLFSAASGTTANNIARWSGSTWSAFGTGTNQSVLALCELPNGDLIAGGTFTMAGGVSCNRIARWNGTAWSTLNFGFNGDVLALAVRSDGALFAAGTFTAAGASSCSRIARWDGFVWQPLGTGMNGAVHALGFRQNGDLVATGAFTSAGGVSADRCARWNGTTWAAMGGSSGDPSPARSVFVLPNGDVVAGRGFHQPGASPDAGIARWNGSTWGGFDTGVAATTAGTSVNVRAITQRADGSLVVGGDFGTAGGLVARGLATLTPTCPASASTYGAGCNSGTGLLSLTADTLPWIGSAFRTTTTGMAPNSLGLGLIGLAQVSVPLAAILAEGQPGCSLLVSLDIAIGLTNGPGTATSSFALANDPALVGVPFFQQTIPLEFDGSGALTSARGSNALALVIGTL